MCPRYLHLLTFSKGYPTSGPATTPHSREERAQIKMLKLQVIVSCVEGWFTSSSCPFDFSNLAALETGTPISAASSKFFSSPARFSIKEIYLSESDGDISAQPVIPLSFTLVDPDIDVDLSQFPALASLPLDPRGHGVLSTLNANNCVEKLIFTVPVKRLEHETVY